MIRLFRYIGFVLASVLAEATTPAGGSVIAMAILLGYLRWRFVWLALPAAGGVAATQGWEVFVAHGKVEHALSNWVYATLIYAILAGLGYGAGRALRRLRRQPARAPVA